MEFDRNSTVLSIGGSKYPPAEPEALRLLAPQRGLIAAGEKQKQLQQQQRAKPWTSAE